MSGAEIRMAPKIKDDAQYGSIRTRLVNGSRERASSHGRRVPSLNDLYTEAVIQLHEAEESLGDARERIAALDAKVEQLEKIKASVVAAVTSTCERCKHGDMLFIEPSTGRYTHTLGGNFCSADGLHKILATPIPERVR